MKTVFRHQVQSSFTHLPNALLQDFRMSIEAAGFIARVLSLPADWEFSKAWAMKKFGVGEQKLERIIRELVTLEYVKFDRERDENGRLGRTVYIFTDTTGKFSEDNEKTPHREKPTRGKPRRGKRPPTKNLLTKNANLQKRGCAQDAPEAPNGRCGHTLDIEDAIAAAPPRDSHTAQPITDAEQRAERARILKDLRNSLRSSTEGNHDHEQRKSFHSRIQTGGRQADHAGQNGDRIRNTGKGRSAQSDDHLPEKHVGETLSDCLQI